MNEYDGITVIEISLGDDLKVNIYPEGETTPGGLRPTIEVLDADGDRVILRHEEVTPLARALDQASEVADDIRRQAGEVA